jgi:hypothetical protein
MSIKWVFNNVFFWINKDLNSYYMTQSEKLELTLDTVKWNTFVLIYYWLYNKVWYLCNTYIVNIRDQRELSEGKEGREKGESKRELGLKFYLFLSTFLC